jgi:glycosyltransferase involved in cell wall biosynthesis
MEAYIAANKLAGSVHLVGYARYSELPKWYAISNVLVHPAIRESWGVSVNEAMACGLPVVAASSVGSSFDLIQNDVNGYQYPSGDVKALANCLMMIASRPDGGGELGECSQRLIKPWDFEATMKSLESALIKVKSEAPDCNDPVEHFAASAAVNGGRSH